jgi:gas vesicle protein
MKKSYLGFSLIVIAVFIIVTGCSNDVASSQEVVIVRDEDGNKYRDNLNEKVDQAKEDYYSNEEEESYVKSDYFDTMQDKVALIIKAVDSDLDNPYNDREKFEETFENLKSEINNLTNEEAAEAVNNLTNPSTIYEATVMWDFHYALDFTDVNSNGNSLSRLIDNYETMSAEEIQTEAKENIDFTEDFEYETLQEIKDSIEMYSEYYSEDQLKSLNYAIENIEKSKETQVNIQKQISATYVISGIDNDVGEMLEEANTGYNTAFSTIESLETDMDVIFVDDSAHNLK